MHQITLFYQSNRKDSPSSSIKEENYRISDAENTLLVDVRSEELLLPYTKITGTFELQSPNLLQKLEKFVVRQ